MKKWIRTREGARTFGVRAAKAQQPRLCSPDAERGLRANAVVCRALAGNGLRKRFGDRKGDQHDGSKRNRSDIDAQVRRGAGSDWGFGGTLRCFTGAGADGSFAARAGFSDGAAGLGGILEEGARSGQYQRRRERQSEGEQDGNDGSQGHVQTEDIGLDVPECGTILRKFDIRILIGMRQAQENRLVGWPLAIIPPFIPAHPGLRASVAFGSVSRGRRRS